MNPAASWPLFRTHAGLHKVRKKLGDTIIIKHNPVYILPLLQILTIICLTNLIPYSTGEPEALGLVHHVGPVTVSNTQLKQQVKLIVPITNKISEFEPHLTEITNLVGKIMLIPALNNETKSYKAFESLLSSIKHELPLLESTIKHILLHRDLSKERTPFTGCTIRWKNIKPQILYDLSKQITTVTANLKWDAKDTDYTSTPTEYFKAHTAVAYVHEFITDASLVLLDRIKLLESFLNKNVNEETMAALGANGCIENAQYEKAKILSCQKNSLGVDCLIEVTALTNQMPYEFYTPVSYKGIQLTTNDPKEFLVKNAQGKWYVLDCKLDDDNLIDPFDFCEATAYKNKCSDNLDKTDFSILLSNCNFTKNEAESYIDSENGVLIQKDFEKIKLKDWDENVKDVVLSDEPPFLIQTSKILELNDNGAKIVINPISNNTEEKIILSWLSDDNIKDLENKIFKEDLIEELDYGAYIDLALILIVTIIIPVIGFLVKAYSNVNMPNNFDEKKRVQQAKNNLKQNKNVLKILR